MAAAIKIVIAGLDGCPGSAFVGLREFSASGVRRRPADIADLMASRWGAHRRGFHNRRSRAGQGRATQLRFDRQCVTLTDPDLPGAPIVYANNRFVEITGCSLSEIIGRNRKLLPGGHRGQEDRGRLHKASRLLDMPGIQYEVTDQVGAEFEIGELSATLQAQS